MGGQSITIEIDFSEVRKSTVWEDERGREKRFPSRQDYLELLTNKGLISKEEDLLGHSNLCELIYLDWLRRGQVGCVFAQLFGRPKNRSLMRTLILCDPINSSSGTRDLVFQINEAVGDSVRNPKIEAISILLPRVLSAEDIARISLGLARLPGWKIEREKPWRQTLTIIRLRVQIADTVWAEVLGLGPFPFLPPTRQSPVTSLEIRTKTKRAIRNKLHPNLRASHLAQIPTEHFLPPHKFGPLFNHYTPWLKRRILGDSDDQRAKAGVTFSVPSAIWHVLKNQL